MSGYNSTKKTRTKELRGDRGMSKSKNRVKSLKNKTVRNVGMGNGLGENEYWDGVRIRERWCEWWWYPWKTPQKMRYCREHGIGEV